MKYVGKHRVGEAWTFHPIGRGWDDGVWSRPRYIPEADFALMRRAVAASEDARRMTRPDFPFPLGPVRRR